MLKRLRFRILKPDGIAVLTAQSPSAFPTSINQHKRQLGPHRADGALINEIPAW
jgi:hypothetical protein